MDIMQMHENKIHEWAEFKSRQSFWNFLNFTQYFDINNRIVDNMYSETLVNVFKVMHYVFNFMKIKLKRAA